MQYRDIAGNLSETISDAIVLDRVAPVTSDNTDAVVHRSFRLVLSPIDATSGVATTEYRVDGGDWVSGDSVGFRLGIRHKRAGRRAGTYLVEYRSTDSAGNVETIQSCTVTLGN